MFAYLLINLESNEQAILEEITNFDEVKDAHILFGEWDLIAKIEVESPDEAATFVMEKIRKLPEVKLTSTLIVAK
jgi:anthranilate phosphoribosyltransferase